MAQETTNRLSASPPLFGSRFLDFFSLHPAVPAVVFVPVIAVMVWLGLDGGYGVQIALLVAGGLLLWTLTEYWLHRLLFHWERSSATATGSTSSSTGSTTTTPTTACGW